MNKKLQEMWDNAHEIPEGAFIPENTVLVQLDTPDLSGTELNYYETEVSEFWKGSPMHAPVRSVEPLPEPNDTGIFTVRPYDGYIVLVDTDGYRCYDLTNSQARNLARMITEAIDGD